MKVLAGSCRQTRAQSCALLKVKSLFERDRSKVHLLLCGTLISTWVVLHQIVHRCFALTGSDDSLLIDISLSSLTFLKQKIVNR